MPKLTLKTPLIAAFGLCAAAPALALDFGNGFSLTGQIEAEHDSLEFDSGSFFFADVTLGWRAEGTGPLRFGADLTVDTLQSLDENDSFTSYWGGLVVTTGLGDLTVGAARPVIDTVYDFPDFGTSELSNFSLSAVRGSLASFFPIIANDEVVVGASLAGRSGALGYGVSAHEIASGPDTIRSAQIALTYDFGDTRILGGFETVDAGTSFSISSISLGVLHDMGALTLGAEYADRSGGFTGATRFARLYGSYDVTEALSVSADIGRASDGSGEADIWALSGEYRFGQGGFVQGGVTDISTDEVFDVGLGFRF